MPLTGLRSFSRAVAISTIWVRKDTDRPSTVAVSRTRRACPTRISAAGPARYGLKRSSAGVRSSFRDPRGTGARGVVAQRLLVLRRGLGPPADAALRPADQGWCWSSGQGDEVRGRRVARDAPRRPAAAASGAALGSAITCSQGRSLGAICAARAARPGRPRRRRSGGGWCGGSGLPRPPGWPRRAPGSCGGSAKSQAIVLNARCMRDERRLAGR